MERILFASHTTTVPRNKKIIEYLETKYEVVKPRGTKGRTIGANPETLSKMLSIGFSSLTTRAPAHFDIIDVFSYPFLHFKEFLLDIRCPVPIELKWLGHSSLASIVEPFMKKCIQRAKVVTAANQPMLEFAHKYSRCKHEYVIPNCPRKSIHVMYHRDEARSLLNMDCQRHVALFVNSGRMREIYGIDLLLETWLRVIDILPKVHLYIIGPFEELSLSKEQIEMWKSKNINFVGWVPREDISKWISSADICVSQRTPGFPSRYYNHSDSLKISEYAAFKKPIVAAGYSVSEQYISTRTNVNSYSDGIVKAFAGEAPEPKPRFWEDNLDLLREAYAYLF